MTGIISASLTLFSIQVGFPVAGILLGDYFLKSQKDKKVRYALGISAFAFGGWLLSNHITTKYLEDVEITLDAESAKDPRIVGLASVYPNPDFHYKDLDGRGYIPTGTNMTKEIAVRVKNWLRDMEGRGFSYIIREDSHNVRYDEEGNQFFSHFPEYIVLDVTNEDDIIDLVETDFSFASFTDDEMDDRPYMFISERFKEMYMTHHPLNTKRSSHLVRYYPAASLEDLDNLM